MKAETVGYIHFPQLRLNDSLSQPHKQLLWLVRNATQNQKALPLVWEWQAWHQHFWESNTRHSTISDNKRPTFVELGLFLGTWRSDFVDSRERMFLFSPDTLAGWVSRALFPARRNSKSSGAVSSHPTTGSHSVLQLGVRLRAGEHKQNTLHWLWLGKGANK